MFQIVESSSKQCTNNAVGGGSCVSRGVGRWSLGGRRGRRKNIDRKINREIDR